MFNPMKVIFLSYYFTNVSSLPVWSLTFVRLSETYEIRVIWVFFRIRSSVFTPYSPCFNSFCFSGTLQISPKISRDSSSHLTLKVEEEESTTEMSFLIDCSMLCLIQPFWVFLSIISFVHVDPLTSEYFSRLLCFTPLFSLSCLAQHEIL